MGHIRWHTDRDPNDPRLKANAKPLPSLDEDPELEVELPEVVEVVLDHPGTDDPQRKPYRDDGKAPSSVTRIGADPNDVRIGR